MKKNKYSGKIKFETVEPRSPPPGWDELPGPIVRVMSIKELRTLYPKKRV